MDDFTRFFARIAHPLSDPHSWQRVLADNEVCRSRTIRIPTGFGKTLGVFAAWAFHRLERGDPTWPRRLVWCLPMRVLVEQTEAVVSGALGRYGVLWDEKEDHGGRVGVHVLMGGTNGLEWTLYPEECAVLIGTQDMLLSRALNRGYGSHRPRWPMEFGLLNQDSLWVLDEVQLMDVGLATSGQLQAFRTQDEPKALKSSHTWWMSATLQRGWLRTVDTERMVDALPATEIPGDQRRGHLWDDVQKPCRLEALDDAKDLTKFAGLVAAEFRLHGRGRLTLVVLNTVDRAQAVYRTLGRLLESELPSEHLHLVHSRFRPSERSAWVATFLRRDAPIPPAGRLLVATQVVEAGVDIDASVLVTELAPWTSLVQRFGRAARGGGTASVVVVDFGFADDRQAAPYTGTELAGARDAVRRLTDVAPLALERFEAAMTSEELRSMYPYQPKHLLLRHEWDELFDTTPDLTGADVDISRFIRSGDERDVQVFWLNVPVGGAPSPADQPTREALCSVPFLSARQWLCGTKGETLAGNKRAWVWDWLEGMWQPCRRSAIVPGRTVLVAADAGGYDFIRGWDPTSARRVDLVTPEIGGSADHAADTAQDAEDLSANPWKTIATHGAEVAAVVQRIALALSLPVGLADILVLAGRWHDLGKAHPAFQGSIRSQDRPLRQDLAKAPAVAWPRSCLYRSEDGDHRPGFRHELVSALALFAVLARHRPDHPALLGTHLEMLRAYGMEPQLAVDSGPPTPDEEAVLALSQAAFDLLAYLVACHHGKVRCAFHAAPRDQDYRDRDGRGMPIRGVREGDSLPPTVVHPGLPPLPRLTLTLEPAAAGLSTFTGSSWTERVMGLQDRYGPASLGLMEACLRSADIRASRLDTEDPLLTEDGPR